ncbi:Ig-like domain-containing protein [Aridibaculum aurantiacum]|uniref:Ig-like domain-containing protein n=1 Tax=Aridibaculum aurantiacum TaxID=2810307 RepID=UPI001A96E1E4|nr:Ig-like domain-containing protein [Aridibaculum aurantiacum]
MRKTLACFNHVTLAAGGIAPSNRNSKRDVLIMIMALVLLSVNGFAQLGQYQFNSVTSKCPNTANTVTTQPANANFSPFTSSGVTCSGSLSYYISSKWNVIPGLDVNRYHQFSITPDVDHLLTLSSITFSHAMSDKVINAQSWAIRSSLDNFTTNLSSGSVNNTLQNVAVTLPAASFTNIGAVTFRLYFYNPEANSTEWINEDVTVFGTVIPPPATPPNPLSNSPQCAPPGVTLSFNGTPPAGVSWFWQTAATGTSTTSSASTYVASASGTYYLRARNNSTLQWSSGAGSSTVTITPNVGVPVFTAGASSSRCQAAGTVNYPATATNTTGITYSLDAASLSAGNTLNSATGAVTFVSTWSGSSVITASAAGCNGPATATHTVTTNPLVAVPVFTSGANSTRCQGAGTVTYAATAANSTGISYSLDASSVSAGNTINTTTGAVSFVAGWTGTSTVTATATGCAGPRTAQHTITTTPTVGQPVFAMGVGSNRCEGAETITYTATSTNTTGITYSLNAAALSGGNTINLATGAVTYVAGWSGTAIITASAAGCNGPVTATHTVQVAAFVGTPVFDPNASAQRCQGAGSVTYTATATNSTNIVYSLDAASSAGGNTIDAATGTVTYVASWTGNVTITAVAYGCNSSATETYTVGVFATTPEITTPVFALGANSSTCQASPNNTFTATSDYAAILQYSLDAASLSAGNTINPNTGEVDYADGWSGTTLVTARAEGCGGPKYGTHSVTVIPNVGTPVFAAGAASTRCRGAATVTYTASATNTTGITYALDGASLSAGNTIDASTGAVSFAEAWFGTSVVTATAAGCNGPSTANHTITITDYVTTPVFDAGGVGTRCQGAGTATYTATASNTTGITYSIDAASIAGGNTINSSTGIVTFVAGWSGTTTITASAAGCSGPRTATTTVTTTPTVGTPVFAQGPTSSRCQAAGTVTYTATATTTTGITYSLDAASISSGVTIDAATGAVTYPAGWAGNTVITASAAGCNGPVNASHTATTNPPVSAPVFALGNEYSHCQGLASDTYTATATATTGITYSLDAASLAGGNTINATTGVVTFASTYTGTTTLTASAAGCYGPQITDITITVIPSVTTPVFASGASSTRCQGAGTVTYTASADHTTGITYSLDASSIAGGNTIDASTGVVTYAAGWTGTSTITASADGCNGPRTATHTVTVTPTVGTPVFSMGATSTRCQAAGTVTYTATASNTTGITYALDAASVAAGNSIDASTGAVTYVSTWSGTSIVTATAAGCNGPATATHTVTITAVVGTPVFANGTTSERCQGAGTVTYTASAANTTGITYSLDAASVSAGNIINSSTGTVTFVVGWSGTSTITASAAGCSGPRVASHIVTVTPTVGTPVFTMGASSNRCQAAGSVTYAASATSTTGTTYSLDATSTSAGITINPSTGEVTYTAGWTGTTTITASAAGCNGPGTATHTVTTNAPVSTPVFSSGASSTRCQGAGTVTYTATATATTGITYTLDAASISAGNAINSTTGAVTYVAGWSGASTITASAAGCYGPQVAQHTVTITPTVGTPVFAMGATSTRCQGAGTVTYTASATNTTGITYSLNAAAVTGGCTINATTGVVTYAAAWTGSTIITASAAGCNGPVTATHTVTITPTVGTPVFSIGATSSRCQAATTVTYTATATNTTGITYSLDATSLAGGNTIDAATGAVTYISSWYGTSVITATAAGCNGPSSASHTVTTNQPVTVPVFASGATTERCQGAGVVTYTASANHTTGITYSLDAASISGGNAINASTGAVSYSATWSGTTIITASAAGCAGPLTAQHTVTVTPTVGTPVFAMGAASARCQAAATITYTATATTTTGITYSLDATSLAAGNTINAATGAVTFTAGWNGVSVITASAAGCNGPATASHTVTTNGLVGQPVFESGESSIRCAAAANVFYRANAVNSTSVTYSLDAASIAAGLSINQGNGRISYPSTFTGTVLITATAEGCSGPTTAVHRATTYGTLGATSFAMGGTSTRCQGAGTVTYTANAAEAVSISYSLNAAAVTAGNSINSATGAVTYVAGWTGSTVITATATGCSGTTTTANHTVTITPTVGTPVFTLGATSTRCQAAGTVTYTASATNTTGITYTLDAASISAGNTIVASTGAVTYAAGWSGTTTITASAAGCNGPATSTHTVTITPVVTTPVFAMGGTSTRCQGAGTVTYTATANNTTGITYSLDAASVSAGNTIVASTGAVTYAAGWSGTTTITASAAGCSGPRTAIHTVTVTPTVGAPVFTAGASSTRCRGAGTTTYAATATNSTGITYSLDAGSISGGLTIDANTGAVTFTAGWMGTTTVTASATGCNGPRTSTHTITTNGAVTSPVFAMGATSTRCQGAGSITYSATATNTTGITYSLDAASIAGGNTIVSSTGAVTYAAGWSGTTTITASAAGCFGPVTADHVVTVTPTVGTPVFAAGASSTRCQGANTATYTATATNSTGITYSLDAASTTAGNTINSSTGAITFVAGWVGTSTVTASAAGCNGPRTATHTITTTASVATPVFAMGATSTRCQGANTVTYAATAANSTSIVYSLDAASIAAGNTINSATGAVTYVAAYTGTSIITATANGCNGPTTASHTVTSTLSVTTPVFASGASSTRCQGAATVTYAASANNTTGITYSLDAASITGGNTINTTTGAVTYAAGWSGTTIITASAAGCNGPATATHTVTVTATVGAPVFAMGTSSNKCQGAETVTYTATATTSTGISYSLDNMSLLAGNTINSATGAVTYTALWNGTSTITATATGCNGPRSSTHTVTVSAYVGSPIFLAGETSTRCQGAGTVTYTATATSTTGVTYSLDGASLAGGNTINSSTGAVTFTAGWSGTSVITASAAGCAGPTTASHTVTITPTVGTPVFASGSISTRCQGAGTITYSASATNSTGITYSIDGTSAAAGNTINSSTGAVTYVSTYSGTLIITASAAGCNGPRTATHTVTITPTVGTPVFAAGTTSTRCQAAGTVTYTATATSNTGISYSLDAASLAAGNTINNNTGAVTFTAAWTGASTITATATGCNGPSASSHTVTTTPLVGTPVFALGATSDRCQGAGTATFTATATNATGITYSLDGTSAAAGNTINTSTGVVTFIAGWSGNSTITATASGCGGTRSATHVVTTIATVGTPIFSMGASSTRCQGGNSVTYSATATTTTGITYSLDGASLSGGNTINAATGEVTYSANWSGTTTITASAAGCNGPRTATHTVTVTPTVGTPTWTNGDVTHRCAAAQNNQNFSATSTSSTGMSYSLDATSLAGGVTLNTSNGRISFPASWIGTSYLTATATGCNGPVSAVHTIITYGTMTAPVFAMGTSSTRCSGAGTVTYTATAAQSVSISYSLNAAALTAGNTINSSTGEVTYVAGWIGTTVITATATSCSNATLSSSHTVTITPMVSAPVFASGASSTRCQGAGTVTYSATAANSTSITYALDAASLAGGNTINSATGAVTFAAGWAGNSTITATASGCGATASSAHTVVTTPTVGTPVFASGASSTRCQGTGTVTYTATATNTTGITYALDAASISGGNTINTTTGAVTYAAGWSGTTTITASAAGCNGPRTASHVVTVTPTVGVPVFTAGAISSRCNGAGTVVYSATATNSTGITYSLDVASSAAGNTIDASTGQVTYAAGWSGTTTITASAAGCNGPRTATHTVTVNGSVTTPVFTSGASSTRCQGATTVTYTANALNTTGITYSLDAASISGGNTINTATGAVTFATGWTGTSTITASAAGCSGPRTSTHTVTTTPTVGTPVFTMGASSTRCQGTATVTYAATATNTTGITYSLDAASISGGNSINAVTGAVTYVGSWTGTSTITASAAGCNGPVTATHTVTINPPVGTPVFAMGASSTRCQGANSITYTATAPYAATISYSLNNGPLNNGVTINAATGEVTFPATWTGNAVVTVTVTGCGTTRTTNHTVTTTPYVGTPVFAAGATSNRCQGAGTVTYTASATNTTSITYSLDAASIAGGNTINSATGAVTYTAAWSGTTVITASAAGCSGPRTSTHTVIINPTVGTPVFALGASSIRCQANQVVTYSATATNSTSITYSLDAASLAAGLTINSSTGAVTFIASYVGTSTITATANGCNGPASANHNVTVYGPVGTPVFSSGASSVRCQGAEIISYAASATNAWGGITYSIDAASAAAGNTINATTGALTYDPSWNGTTIVTASAAGCNGPATATHTISITPTVGTPVFANGETSIRCQGAATIQYTATATNSTGITYTLDPTSITAGNTINSGTGRVTFVAGWAGTSVVTASASGCNGPSTAAHSVTVTPTVGFPVFALGTSSTRCQGAGVATYSATATDATGMTYSLDATSTAAGNTIDAATGQITFIASWTGTSTVTATATGCNGPRSSTHTLNTTPSVSNPVFVAGPTSSRCQGAGTVTITATANNSTSVSYSLDAASVSAGNTINASTGEITFVSTWTGNTIVTATAQGCNGPATADHILVTNPPVGTPVFAMGSNSGRCRGAATITYSASATAMSGISYSLDGTSLVAGNTINSTTGTVTWVAGWTGTSTITASAAGCSGPRSATHIVMTTGPVSTPVFSAGATSTRCQAAGTVTYTATATNTSGITYSLDGASLAAGNTIVASTGAVTYAAGWNGTTIITASAAGCEGPRTATHTVTVTANVGVPVFARGTSSTRCQAGGTVSYSATATSSTGISYSLDNTSIAGGNSINSATGVVTFSAGWTGTSVITATASGCGGPTTSTHTVITLQTVTAPIFALGATSERCQGAGTVTYTASANHSTGITYSINAAATSAGNTIDPTTGVLTYAAGWIGDIIITASAAGCNGPALSSHTATTRGAVGTPVFSMGTSSTRCQGGGVFNYTVNAPYSTGLSFSLDAISLTAGNTINAATGSISFVPQWSGTSTITVTASGCSGPVSATHDLTTIATVGLVTFNQGPTSTRCPGAGTVSYAATASSSNGISYALDNESLAGGVTINPATGVVTYPAEWFGTSIVTAIASGCNGPSVGTHTVTTYGILGNPSFSFGPTSTRCRGVGTVAYIASAPNNFGLVYSLDAASLAAGNSINSATGAVSFVLGWSGTSVITVTAMGCPGNRTATHTVTTTPNTCAVTMIANTTVKTIPKGSILVNTGIVPQTGANALKPYGLVHELLRNNIPVEWVYNQSKIKDGVDLVHNNVVYRAGVFIINEEFLAPNIMAIINNWASQGVIINTAVSDFNVEVIHTLKTAPTWMIDESQTIIGRKYFEFSGIPNSAWTGIAPANLNNCHDIFVLPHADASWERHQNMYYWNETYKGNIWVGCYAASGLENLYGPDRNDPTKTIKMNFLMKDGPALGQVAVPFTRHQNASPPFQYNYSGFPIMQFMGKTDNAHMNGPQTIYLPHKQGGWRPSTFIGVYDPTQKNIPQISNGEAAAIAFGRAFGDDQRGWVMYTSGHHIANGTTPEEVAATRSFLNFSFFSLREKKPSVMAGGIQSSVFSGQVMSLTAFASSQDINPTFTYQWVSSCGGSFSDPTGSTTTFNAPSVTTETRCLITCIITDNCGRKAFDTRGITLYPNPRPPVCAPDVAVLPNCDGSTTLNVLANDSDPDGGALSVMLIGNGSQGTFVNNGDGTVTYTPHGAFTGSDQISYRVTNPNGLSCTSTITVTMNNIDAYGCRPHEFYTVVGTINAMRATPVGNNLAVNMPASLGDPDGIPGDGTTYTTFGNRNNVVNYTLSQVIPATDTLWFYVDGTTGGQFTVSRSTDSINWTNPVTYTVNAADDFLEARAKAYIVTAGVRWVKVTIPATTVQIDAMQYNLRSCVSANPVADHDEVATLEDVPVTIEVDANDYDPQGKELYVTSIVEQPLVGKVSINLDNTITYLNLKDQIGSGVDSFTYRICNSAGLCANATVVVRIAADGCGPGAYKPVTYSTYTIALNPVMDTYLNNDGNRGTSNSIIVKGRNGSIHRGLLQFNMAGIPANAIVDQAVLRLYQTAGPTSEAVKIHRVTRQWNETSATWSAATATTNWTTAGGDFNSTIVASNYLYGNNPAYKNFNIRSVVQDWVTGNFANYGVMLTRNPEGSGTKEFIFNSREAGSNRPMLLISYRVPLACTAIPAYAPLAMPDTTTTNSVTPVTIRVTQNDYDYNNTGLSVELMTTTTSHGGTLTKSGNSVIYTPPATNPAFNGVDTFCYRVSSGNLWDTSRVFINVLNAKPRAVADSFAILSNTVSTPSSFSGGNIRVNDSDPEASTLSLPVIVKTPKNGVATISATGTLSYTPNVNFIGRDTVWYSITENTATSCSLLKDTAMVIMIVNNRPPVSTADSYTINACEATEISPLLNDMDPEFGVLRIEIVTQPSTGVAELTNNNSQILYIPPAGVNNAVTSFTYRACDNQNPSLCGNTVTVSLTIRPMPTVNNAPVTVRDTFRTDMGALLYADVLTNDSDPDGHEFKLPVDVVTQPVHGTVVPMENGLMLYTPNPTYYGIDSFQYRITDSIITLNGCPPPASLSATEWAIIIVQDAPIATWERVATGRGVPVIINVLDNDIFGAHGPRTGRIAIAMSPSRGASEVLNNGSSTQAGNTIRYTPQNGFSGLDSLIYLICDNKNTCDTAIVYIWVGADSDSDGVPDEIDIDDDNDGIPDYVEVCGAGATGFSCTPNGSDPSADDDGDGVINYKDAKWCVLNSAGTCAFLDTDGDGVPDYLDKDSDNDGIPDVIEALGVDANGDGIIDNFCDRDGDGLSDNVDANLSGAANSGQGLGAPDFDNDGIPNSKDLDSDNDGIPDIVEAYAIDANNDGRVDNFVDNDGDGWSNQYDGDANGDFIVENLQGVLILTAPQDYGGDCMLPLNGRATCYTLRGNADNHGYPNFIDLDSDGDGITDATESGITATSYNRGMVTGCTLANGWCSSVRALNFLLLRNTDTHGRPDVYDIDSDNDGITDNVEAQPTSSYIVPTDVDTDGDGLVNVYDFFNGIGGNGLTPYDHDADGVPDYRDTDTDNDGAPDRNEGDMRFLTFAQTTINSDTDLDGDGLMDCFDIHDLRAARCGTTFMNVGMSNMGPTGNYDGPSPGGSTIQLVKSVSTAADRDWRNSTTLPLNIISFNGKLVSNVANLVWKVENEQEVDKYIVERSSDGVNFGAEGIRLSNNSNTATYTFADDLSLYVHNVVYYRIRQVNKDGQYFHTKTIMFSFSKDIALVATVYPNPVIDKLTVTIPSLSPQQGTIVIADASGKTVMMKKVELEKGENRILMEGVERLSKGVYLVQVRTAEISSNIKVVKQ